MKHAILFKKDYQAKKKILSLLLTLLMITSVIPVAVGAVGYAEPIAGGRTTWDAYDIMYPGDAGTMFHGAFTQPTVWNPIGGRYEHWTGVYFERTTYQDVECVEVSIDPDGNTLNPIMDYNYYQWDSEYYMPSLDATKNSWLKIKYAYNDAASEIDQIKFYASKDSALGETPLKKAEKTFDIVNGNGEWQEVIVDLSDIVFDDGTTWGENTIRQFRLHMFEGNNNPDAVCYIAGFGFFESEEAAEAWDYGVKSDSPVSGGRTAWEADDIMYPGDPGTKYHGAFIQPTVYNPIDGWYEHWTGVYFEKTTYQDVECVEVSIDPDGNTLNPIMDYNYYQWDADYYMPSLDATKNSWLKIKYAYNGDASEIDQIKFYASKDSALGETPLKKSEKTVDIVNGDGEWQEIIIDLSDMVFDDGTSWGENTIRQFRLHMFEGNTNPDAACYIAGFGFFESEEAAKAWGAPEEEIDSYLVVTKYTDYELYDHAVLSAIIDGTETSIKVKTINEKKADGVVVPWANIPNLDANSLAEKLADIFGVYTYTVDADGFYTLTKQNRNMHLKDYVSTVEDGYVSFQDWETVGVLDANANGNTRDEIIRVNSATTIYLVDFDEHEVTMIKPSSYFSINLNIDTDPLFMIDRIGYGNPDGEYADGIGYGVASVICIETSKEYVDETYYKLVYVQEDVSSTSSGFAADYGLQTGVMGETYFKYVAENDEAYLATVTFKTVEEIFVSNTYRTNHLGGANLVAGLYLVNGENIVIDHKTVSTLTSESASERYLNHGNTKIAYDLWDVAGDDINLYDYKYIAIEGKANLIGSNIQTIKFRFFEEIDGELIATDLKNERLVDYMTENFCTITKPDEDDKYTWTYDYKDVRVLIIPNTMSGFDKNLEFINNTLAGIVVAEAIPETDANIVVAGGRCRAGETVDVTISLENNPGVAFMRLSVDYDSNAMKLVEVKDAGILGIEVHSDNLTADPYTLYWENSTIRNNITSNGTAVTLTFEVDENAEEGSYPITVTYDNTKDDIMDVDFGEVYFNVINGAVEVVDFIYGDVNGDFEVTPVDSATLSRYLAKWTGYGEDVIDPDASDVNCDGSVTAVDSAMLSRHLAKWTGYETLPIEE